MADSLYLNAITNMGNAAVVGALAVTFTANLILTKSRRAAAAVMAAFAISALLIVAMKLITLGCSANTVIPYLKSPSGHVAISSATYWTMAVLLSIPAKKWQRVVIRGAAFLLIAGIALSRWLLHLHSPEEIAAGFLVGLLSYLIVRRWLLTNVSVSFNGMALFVSAAAMLVIALNVSIPAEDYIQALAQKLHHSINGCVPALLKSQISATKI